MCGIVGIVYHDAAHLCDESTVVAMRDIATYRGPDDAGVFVAGPVGLGHRRLSIIDLSGGHQPMAEDAGRLQIVFNGEIYNYREVRERLKAKGYQFRTNSDTEVILQAYVDVGERCVDALNGMFAFAIWDGRRRSLFLARDRMGVKPLYYARTAKALVFGSEVKSLFASGLVSPQCRTSAVAEHLLFRQVAGPHTLFESVKSLPPAHTMTVTDGRFETRRYWSPRTATTAPVRTYREAAEEFAALLEDSVRLRLISDVPVGTFCSGGVDSSLVTALAARLKGDGVNTYSIGFDDAEFDESAFAHLAARHCRTRHHELRVGNEEFDELLPRMAWHNDEPLDFPNSIHIYALSRLAKAEVTVVLTGEGADELFAGYPRYRVPGLLARYRKVPRALRALAIRLIGDHRLAKLERAATGSHDDAFVFNASYLAADDLVDLCPAVRDVDLNFRRQSLQRARETGADDIGTLSLLDQDSFLVGILNRQDKMSMAASIESRVPFMDYRLVEFANRIPARLRVFDGVGKALVKNLARTVLPEAIVDRRKSGFGVPLARWMRAPVGLGERVRALPRRAGAVDVDRAVLSRLVDEHVTGTRDHSETLWTIMSLVEWREAFGA